MTKNCNKCGCELEVGENWTEILKNNSQYICVSCLNEYARKSYNKRRGYNPQRRIRTKVQLKDRVEVLLNEQGPMDGKELYHILLNEFGGKFGPSQGSAIQQCICDRQHRFKYENKTMRLRTVEEIHQLEIDHGIVGCE